MKLLLGCALMVAVSGCIPIGIQGRTSAVDAPSSAACARPTAMPPPAAAGGVSV